MPQSIKLLDMLPNLSSSNVSIKKALNILSFNSNAAFFKVDPEEREDLDEIESENSPVNDAIYASSMARLASFENWADDTQLSRVLQDITKFIVDYPSAIQAIDNFGITWFKALALSNRAKCQVACLLNDLCMNYAKSNNEFWVNLINGDASTMDMVSFSYVSNGTEE